MSEKNIKEEESTMTINTENNLSIENSTSDIDEKENAVLWKKHHEYTLQHIMTENEIFAKVQNQLDDLILTIKFIRRSTDQMMCLFCNTFIPMNVQSCALHILDLRHRDLFKKAMNDNRNQIDKYVKVDFNKRTKCYCCNLILVDIEQHISSYNHKQLFKQAYKFCRKLHNSFTQEYQDIWYNVSRFSCTLCNLMFTEKYEFVKHISKKHLRLLPGFSYNFCLGCGCLWLGPEGSYAFHSASIMHKRLREKNYATLAPLSRSKLDLLKKAEYYSNSFVQESNKAIETNINIEKLVDSLNKYFKLTAREVTIYKFGSRENCLGFTDSDLNIYIDFDNGYFTCVNQTLQAVQTKTKIIETFFSEVIDLPWKVTKTIKDKVFPKVVVKHLPSGLNCDISFTNGIEVESTKILRYYMTLYPLCRRLTLFVRKLWDFKIFEKFMPSYALTWLVIFYLQVKSSLPSIVDLRNNVYQVKMINGFETSFNERTPAVPIRSSFKFLLYGFFKYYGEFDYRAKVLCPLLGREMSKLDFVNYNNIPDIMENYKNNLKKYNYRKTLPNNRLDYFRVDCAMCLQDPLNLSCNLTNAVSVQTVHMFRMRCLYSTKLLTKLATKAEP
ncbi:speckle targeted PIP5K1A-regulated poly(A) polymerase-like isoform X2 [Prorops nasuta]|uniref:speckle targeted PIP5K1A-regulated poly(A) polymerase-like isoform X2 n=1 Tax=Prorops nasuta TaxID=863751 RepID=UPI0034CF4C00